MNSAALNLDLTALLPALGMVVAAAVVLLLDIANRGGRAPTRPWLPWGHWPAWWRPQRSRSG